MRILLVEDSRNLALSLAASLKYNHYVVDTAFDGETGYDCAITGIYDAIVLDLMLPKMNGYDVLKRLRQEGVTTPVLILSAKSELYDKVPAFELGADDYLTKPFETKELILRLGAITRRQGAIQTRTLTAGTLELNLDTCKITGTESGKSVNLGGKEFQLLEYLMHNKGLILTREQIACKIWGYDTNSEYNSVEVYISFLRKKLNFVQCNVKITTIRGVGYTLKESE